MAFTLMSIELVIPIAITIITVSFFANLLMPNLVLPALDFFGGLVANAFNLGTETLLGITILNPFAGIANNWVDLDATLYVNMLLDILDTLHDWLVAI